MTKTEIRFAEFIEDGKRIQTKEELHRWGWRFAIEFKKKMKDNLPLKFLFDYEDLYAQKEMELNKKS